MSQCVKLNSKYIYTDENKYIFDEFVKSPSIIAISSPYGTGKTYTFNRLIPNFEKILFITYRRSLSNSLKRELSSAAFKTYNELSNDALLNTDRLIIQLDSLGRLNVEDDFTLEDSIPIMISW
jgi:superfamily II DNA or RNA helicase